MNLFRVTCRGFTHTWQVVGWQPGRRYKTHYVLANDADQAYAKVLAFLESNDIGVPSERLMEKVELIAGPPPSPACGTLLHF